MSREIKIGSQTILLPNEFQMQVNYHGTVLVLFSFNGLPKEKFRRNIWAFDENGNFLWEIQAVADVGLPISTYTHIRVVDGRVRVSSTFSDVQPFYVNVETGAVSLDPADVPVR